LFYPPPGYFGTASGINTGDPAGAAGPTVLEKKYFGPSTVYGANLLFWSISKITFYLLACRLVLLVAKK
jgi:hypothetical protein